MAAAVFIDTNVFFYAQDDRFPQKRSIAQNWIRMLAAAGAGVSNLQVMNEFTNAVFRRMPHLQTGQVFAMADEIGSFGTAPVSIETVAQARTLRLANGFSWWDCLLLASAAELGCSHFLSEDLHDGQKIGAMIVVDPFLHDPADILGA